MVAASRFGRTECWLDYWFVTRRMSRFLLFVAAFAAGYLKHFDSRVHRVIS